MTSVFTGVQQRNLKLKPEYSANKCESIKTVRRNCLKGECQNTDDLSCVNQTYRLWGRRAEALDKELLNGASRDQ